jgi:cell division protein FtsL
MDEAAAKQLSRQIRVLNRWVRLLALMFLVWFIVLAVLVVKIASYAHTATSKINGLEQKASKGLNAQQELCNNQTVRTYLQNDTAVCN